MLDMEQHDLKRRLQAICLLDLCGISPSVSSSGWCSFLEPTPAWARIRAQNTPLPRPANRGSRVGGGWIGTAAAVQWSIAIQRAWPRSRKYGIWACTATALRGRRRAKGAVAKYRSTQLPMATGSMALRPPASDMPRCLLTPRRPEDSPRLGARVPTPRLSKSHCPGRPDPVTGGESQATFGA